MAHHVGALEFGRLITAMITPFNERGEVDYSEAIRIGEHLVETGTETLLLAGTTGESPTLTHEEEFVLFDRFVKHFKGKVKLMAGTGSNSTATAIRSTQMAESLGVDAVLQVVPYYNKPSQEGLYHHFKTISESTSLPILLYNIPGRTGIHMQAETVARLAEIPTIFGIKEASGKVENVIALKEKTPDDFLIYSGDDALTLDFMAEGAVGVVSVAGHLVGKAMQEMMSEFLSGNIEKSRQIESGLKQIFNVLFITSNPVPVKAAMRLRGFSVGVPRLPLVDVTEAELRQIQDVIRLL
jgi:4-hydroxy-tetrahydrodipicolinate synthase